MQQGGSCKIPSKPSQTKDERRKGVWRVCASSEIRQATKGKRKRRGVAGKKRGCTLFIEERAGGRKGEETNED
jgi:hypothetical protein